jgi:two-component system, sensor histidine kinase PdtaS
LGFIVNELVTNSMKYAKGNIIVRLIKTSPYCLTLSVLDDGPGFPTGFNPEDSKGLGMKIILSLVKQIGGELQICPGDHGHGACFAIAFRSSSDNGT